MDEAAARDAFRRALETHRPDFETFFFARLLGLDFAYEGEAADTRCVVSFDVLDWMFNPQGSLHGGIIASVMDISMGHCIRKVFGIGGATLEMKQQYLAPLRTGRCRVVGRFLRRTRSIQFMQSDLFDPDDKLCVSATSTWKVSVPDGSR